MTKAAKALARIAPVIIEKAWVPTLSIISALIGILMRQLK